MAEADSGYNEAIEEELYLFDPVEMDRRTTVEEDEINDSLYEPLFKE